MHHPSQVLLKLDQWSAWYWLYLRSGSLVSFISEAGWRWQAKRPNCVENFLKKKLWSEAGLKWSAPSQRYSMRLLVVQITNQICKLEPLLPLKARRSLGPRQKVSKTNTGDAMSAANMWADTVNLYPADKEGNESCVSGGHSGWTVFKITPTQS